MTTSEFFLSGWVWNPWPVLASVAAVLAYGWRYSKWLHPGLWWFLAAIVIFLLTLVSPLENLANGDLFSAHMAQHLLLLLIVPALVLLSLPKRQPPSGPRPLHRLTRILTFPITTWIAGVGAMWLWHAPALCDAATTSRAVRTIQVLSLLLLGILFWWPILGPDAGRRIPALAGVVYLFTACLGCTALGILITFSPVSVCPVFLQPHHNEALLSLVRDRWGMSPTLDQQVGGLMMWVPACSIYVVAIVALLARWYSDSEPEQTATEKPQTSSTKSAND